MARIAGSVSNSDFLPAPFVEDGGIRVKKVLLQNVYDPPLDLLGGKLRNGLFLKPKSYSLKVAPDTLLSAIAHTTGHDVKHNTD